MNGLEASFQLSINGRSGPRRPLPAGLSGHARKQGADLISAATILQLGGRHGGQRLGYLLHPPNFNFVLRQLPAAPFSTMSLANPLLGVIGIARIRTVIVWVHHAVPFGTDNLIVFRPCFRLVHEHSWHCWGILIRQNCAQHPDLDFHGGVLLVGSMFVGWLESGVFRIYVGRSRCPHMRPSPRRLEWPSRVTIT